MRDFHALQARTTRSIKPNQTKSNLLGVGDGGSDSGQWFLASGWWRKRPSEYRPVKPSQTQSNRIKPNQTCRSVESDEKGRWNTGWSNLVKPSQTSWGQLACPEIGQSDGERTRRKAHRSKPGQMESNYGSTRPTWSNLVKPNQTESNQIKPARGTEWPKLDLLAAKEGGGIRPD
jgi:hypothetical protein